MIISGFPGIGKTTLSKKYSNVIDMESTDYKYILTEEENKISREILKGIDKKQEDTNWPKNYIEEIIKNNKVYDVIFVSHHTEVVEQLKHNKIPYIIAIPDLDCKLEYLKRFKQRGNNNNWINYVISNYDEWISRDLKSDENKIVLKKGEYIEDILKRMNIKLIERKI